MTPDPGHEPDVDLEAAESRIATLKRQCEHWRAVPVPQDLVHELDLVHRLRRAQASPRGRTAPDPDARGDAHCAEADEHATRTDP